MKLGRVFLIFLVLLMMSSCANAYVRYQPADSQIRIYDSVNNEYTLDDIDVILSAQDDATYGGPYPDIITFNSTEGYYYINNAYINMLSASGINVSDCKIRFCNYSAVSGKIAIDGVNGNYFRFVNTTIQSYNLSTSSPITAVDEQMGLDLYNPILNDFDISYMKFANILYPESRSYTNITMHYANKSTGNVLVIKYGGNITIDNLNMSNTDGPMLYVGEIDNVTISNFTSINAGNYTNPGTGSIGIWMDKVTDFELKDFYVNGTGWSSVDLTDESSTAIYIHDGEIYNTGHNGIDLHAGTHVTVKNVIIGHDATEHNTNGMLATGAGAGGDCNNITVENVTTYGHDGNGFLFTRTWDFQIINSTSENNGGGFTFLTGVNGIVSNCSSYNNSLAANDDLLIHHQSTLPYVQSNNITVLDCDFPNTLTISNASDIYITNPISVSKIELTVGYANNHTVFYPLNVKVVDGNGTPISGANVTLNLTTFGLNGLGQVTLTSTTDATGHPNPILHVPDFNRDSVLGYTYYIEDTVSVEKNGISNESSAFNPDETWYSTNLSALNGTEIILTLDLSPITIDSYLPLIDPTSTEGDTQEFSVNLSKSANVTWYIDSVEVQTNTSVTSASYTNSTAPVGVYNVTASAFDGNATANRSWVWTVTEEQVSEETFASAKSNMQYDTENTISLAVILPTIIIAFVIIVILYGMSTGTLEFDIAMPALLVMFILWIILMASVRIFNGLYS